MAPKTSSIVSYMVRTFMQFNGIELRDTPGFPSLETTLERQRMVTEEYAELIIAIHERDLVRVADAAGDLLYTVYGLCLAFGFDPEPVLDIVCNSNLSKDRLDQNKKGGKGPRYVAPEPRIVEYLQGLSGDFSIPHDSTLDTRQSDKGGIDDI